MYKRQPDNWVTIDGREFNVFFHAPTTDVAWPLTSGTDASVTADLAWPAENDPPPLIRELMASIEPVDRDRWRAVTDDLPAPSTP